MEELKDAKLKQAFVDANHLEAHLPPVLLEAARLRKIGAGEYLILQGSALTSLYLLVEGKLQVEHYQIHGYRAVFSIETAFSVIGDLELFWDKENETVSTVKAATDACLLELPLAKVRQHGLDNPAFLRFICQQLSEKLFVSSRLHSNVALKAIYKIAKYLTYRCQTDGAIIQLEKREAIAAMLGVSVRQLNRALKELAEQGLITFKNKTVKVLDESGLTDVGPIES